MSAKRISDLPKFFQIFALSNNAAILRAGAKILLGLHLQKLQSLKWQIGAKARKKQKQNIYCCYFCSVSKAQKRVCARNAHDK